MQKHFRIKIFLRAVIVTNPITGVQKTISILTGDLFNQFWKN